ncbi:MAG TPA: GyrI-like domain-containing protein [Xanthobacteraceae bacterium]|nr:GyrI-like domain-containing protein [Xanthobacteraceae bacterium]
MFPRFALGFALAAAVSLVGLAPCWAQKPAPPPASATKSDSAATTPAPAAPAAPSPASAAAGDPFGEDTTLAAKPIVYVKGAGTWDSAFETITASLKKLKTYVDKEGLKSDGLPITIFTATDDTGFQFEAALPVTEAPKKPPHGDIAAGTSPEGHALKFVHRGSYDGMDNTYEAITNYLDEKRLEAKDMFIEQYVTDPLSTSEENLIVNVFVMIK